MRRPAGGTGFWLRRPGTSVGVAAGLVLLAALLASGLKPSHSMNTLLPRDDPAAVALGQLMQNFAIGNELLLLVEADEQLRGEQEAVESLRAFAQRFEAAVAEDQTAAAMVERIQWSAGEDAVRFAEEQVAPRLAFYLDDGAFEQLLERLTEPGMKRLIVRNEAMLASGPAADALARQVLRDPLRLHELLGKVATTLRPAGRTWRGGSEFITTDGRAMLIRVAAVEPPSDLNFTKQFMPMMRQAIHRALAETEHAPHVSPAGGYAIAELSEREIRRDMMRSIIGAVVLLQLAFFLIYRRAWVFALVLLPAAAGIVVAFGLYSVTGLPLTPITAVIGAMLAGLGVDYGIHYLAHYQTQRKHASSAAAAATRVNVALAGTMAAACVTSLIAFAAIGTSSVAALQQFALLGVLGLAGALLASLTLLPAMLTLLERIGRSGVGHVGALRFDAAWFLQIAHRHRRSCWATGAVLTGAAGITLAIAGGVRFDDDLHAMHPQPNKPLVTQTEIATMFGQAPEPMVVLLQADDESALLDLAARVDHHIDASAAAQAAGVRTTLSPARLLPTAAHVERRLERLDEIGVTSMLASFDAVIEESIFNPDAFADYREYLRRVVRPKDSPTIQTLRHYPQLAATVLPRTDHESVEHMGAVLVYFEDRVTNREQRDAAITALREALTHVEGATLSGMPVIAHDVEQAVRTELGQLFGVAATLVIVWLIVIYRNGRDVALVLIPAVFGGLILLSGMYWMGIGFNMMNLIALPLLAGIGVDDGIFLVSAARQRQTGGVAASCHAITMTSATTALAFGSLLLTSTPAIQSLGAVLAIGIVASYIGAAWVLAPWLIENIEREAAA